MPAYLTPSSEDLARAARKAQALEHYTAMARERFAELMAEQPVNMTFGAAVQAAARMGRPVLTEAQKEQAAERRDEDDADERREQAEARE